MVKVLNIKGLAVVSSHIINNTQFLFISLFKKKANKWVNFLNGNYLLKKKITILLGNMFI